MTTLSALDARFACLCGGASSAHSIGAGLRMRCEHCKECEGYRPARCVCHVRRDDGPPIRCYFEHGNGGVVENTQVRRSLGVDQGHKSGSNPAHSQPFWQSLAAAREEKILAEAGPNPGPEYVLVNDGRYRWADKHEGHKRLSVSKRIRECRECGERAIRAMCALPETDHRGRNGRRLAEIHGVK